MFGRIRILAILVVLLLSLLSIGVVSAANGINSGLNSSEVYVAVNGSDEAGNGTVGNPYQSLKSAVSFAGNGSTIYMFEGKYSGLKNAKLTVDKTLTISTWNGMVTLDGEKSRNFFDVTINGNLTLNGLKLINGSAEDDFNNGIFTAGAIRNNGQLTIINSTFNNNTGFLAGAILNYGTLFVLDSTFKANNGTNYVGGISSFNYAGGITNFGVTNIQNNQFTDNTGGAILNVGNTTVNSSNFISNAIRCDNFDDTKNSLTVQNSFLENAALAITNSTFYMYNSSLSSSSVNFYGSNATIIGSSFGSSYLFLYYNSSLNINYSVLGGIYAYDNSTAQASYNWWGSNKKPDFYSQNILVDYWIIMTFTSNRSSIPSKTDVTVTAALNKYTDGTNIYSLGGGVYLPSRYVSFETDNGLFSSSGGYLVNNSYSTNYLDNTEDTWIYAAIDNQKLRLIVGTGWTDYSIYVSNEGDDYYGDGSKNNPYKTLQKAVSKALNGNKIYLFPGNYSGLYNSDLYINKYLTFNSFNGKASIYRHSNLNLFNITEFGELNLNNLNIYSEMSYNVLLINNNGVLVLTNCTVANSTGCIGGNGLTKVYNSKFYNIIGPAIYSTDIIIANSSFTNISPTPASNYNNEIIRSDGNLKVTNSTFSNSSSTIYGKRFIGAYGNLTITNSTFINNKLTTLISGGSLISGSKFINNIGAVFAATVENCTFVNNTGLYLGANTITNSLFMDNSIAGSIVRISGGHISNSRFINNSNTIAVANYEDYSNYGIVFTSGNSTITQCTFLNNFAAYGGAIYNAGNLTVSYSVFINNTAKYLGDEVYNRMGSAYLLLNWWGSNSGPTGDKVYRFLGDVYAYNWVILTLTVNGNVLKASLDKVTDVNGTIRSLGGILPSREVFFDGEVGILPKKADLVGNYASATITSGSERDFRVYATVDNQTVDLMVRNTSTVIDVSNAAFYGKGNIYKIVLRNVNGYLISNQTLKVTLIDQNGKSQVYSLVTDGNGVATLTVDNPVGVYRVSVVYGGDGYFRSSSANATIQVLIAITRIISYDETFYGKENKYYATLYDVNGKGIPGQKLTFTITYGKQSKTYTAVTDDQGRAGVAADFPQGKYNVKVSYNGNSWYGSSSSTSSFTVYQVKSVLKLLTSVLYGRGNPFVVELRDAKGNVIRNKTITFILSQGNLNQTFNLTTNENGITGLMINLYPGLYNVTAKYNGSNLYGPTSVNGTLTINKVAVKLRADSVISNFKGVYDVLLTDIYDRPLVGESVSVTVVNQKSKTTYSAKTDSKGIARFLISLNIGNYLVVSNFYANSWYNSTTTASTLIVSNFNVTSIDPANGTTKVASNKTIKVTFSENIKKGNNFWVELKNSSGKAVSFTSSVFGKVLTIKPKSKLVESLYTLIIHTGAVTNLVDNPISLTTSKFSVGTAPTITKFDPANSATKVSANKTIKVTFSENIKKGKNFWIELVNSSKKAVSFTSSVSGKVLSIKPKSKLAESLYTLIIHTGSVTDLAGNPVALKSTKFSVGTAPKVSKTDPKSGAIKVASNKIIKVTFNENIKKGSKFWVELKNSSKKAVSFTSSVSGKVLSIKPKSKLAESLYTLIIHTGAVMDLAGNPVALKSSKFSVGTAPKVSKVDPKNGATNIARNKVVKVTFNENIKKGSNYWIELVASNGAKIAIKKSIKGKILTITPTKQLKANTKYKLVLHSGAVTDLAGNPVALKTISFTTRRT